MVNKIKIALAAYLFAAPIVLKAEDNPLLISLRGHCGVDRVERGQVIKAFEKLQLDLHDFILINYYSPEF
ncbi:MAG: hypothetical protein LW832_11095 [Parachlamydia sp.]|jgi:hypothetical protein|nr:hypothetical protein [Parachlamydia sp.]